MRIPRALASHPRLSLTRRLSPSRSWPPWRCGCTRMARCRSTAILATSGRAARRTWRGREWRIFSGTGRDCGPGLRSTVRCRSQASAERLLVSGKLCGAAPGTYSDLDYALWGFSAERVLGASLWDLLQERALKPLGIEGVAKMPGRELDVVRCLCGNGREVELGAEQGISIAPRGGPDLGQPQDGNARFLGGLAGHAGLFVTTMGLLGLGRVWLDTVNGSASLLPPQEALRAISGGAPWAMGWARRRVRGSAGPALSAVAFGHVGFTGTSLWIDQERNRIYSLLAHRRQLDRDSNSWRRRFHALAAALPG